MPSNSPIARRKSLTISMISKSKVLNNNSKRCSHPKPVSIMLSHRVGKEMIKFSRDFIMQPLVM